MTQTGGESIRITPITLFKNDFIFRMSAVMGPFAELVSAIFVYPAWISMILKSSEAWTFKIKFPFFSKRSFPLSNSWHLTDLKQQNMFKLMFPIVNVLRLAKRIRKHFINENDCT